MKSFEENIRKNKRLFDSREPDKDHLARFILKLEKDQQRKVQRNSPFFFLKIAASVILLAAISIVLFTYLKDSKQNQQQTHLIVFSSDLNEAMAYYDEVSEAKMSKIEKVISDPSEANKIKETAVSSLEDLDIRLAEIEKEYMKNPENMALKAALINNKRKKVEVLDRILSQIDLANTYLY
jgi:hypothetical protein